MSKSTRINIRFGPKDKDLQLLASSNRFDDVITYAIDHYLGKVKAPIPLPNLDSINAGQEKTIYTLYLDNITDKDAIDLLQGIPAGYRSFALKLLIRHAMERCDLRALQAAVNDTPAAPKKKQPSARYMPRMPTPQQAPISPPRPTQKQSLPHSDEDDVFNAI